MDGLLLSMLKKRRREHIHRFPQLACYAFDHISTEITVRGQFERSILECLATQLFPRLRQRRLCLDVGANIGNHSLAFAAHFERVLAFEPNPRTFRLLAINAEIPGNVTPFPLGASNKRATVTAYQDTLNLGATTTRQQIADDRAQHRHGVIRTVRFEVDRLDHVLKADDRRQVDFIKLDIEGQEAEALEGMGEIIGAAGPVIAMELLPESIVAGTSQPIEILRSHGYRHIYGLEASRRDIHRLPKFMRKPIRRVRKLFGSSVETRMLKPMDDIEPRYHCMLLCSRHALA